MLVSHPSAAWLLQGRGAAWGCIGTCLSNPSTPQFCRAVRNAPFILNLSSHSSLLQFPEVVPWQSSSQSLSARSVCPQGFPVPTIPPRSVSSGAFAGETIGNPPRDPKGFSGEVLFIHSASFQQGGHFSDMHVSGYSSKSHFSSVYESFFSRLLGREFGCKITRIAPGALSERTPYWPFSVPLVVK